MNKNYRLVVLPGEGIGPEVVEASLKILKKVSQLHHFSLTIDHRLIGKPAFESLGEYFPQSVALACEKADAILLGAVTQGGLLELRKHFDLYINLRPVKISPSLLDKSSLKPEKIKSLDILFVRELTSGIYFGPGGRGENPQGSYGYHTMYYEDWEIKRIAQAALQQASKRKGKLTVAHKENALPHLPWTAIVKQEAKNFPTVTVEGMFVDNLAMQLVLNPQGFDVILASNLFGDILSDIGGALVGSIGLLGSASLNAQGFGLYEAIHGSAPDIAGKGIANPIGTIQAIVLMLQQWGENQAALTIINAQEKLLAKGYRTPDLNPQPPETLVNTNQFIDLFLTEL